MVDSKLRIVDMMCSMHGNLAHCYKNRAMVLELLIMLSSTAMLAFTFCNPESFSEIGVSPIAYKYGFGLTSILVFSLSIVSLIIDWNGMAANHKSAFDALLILKSELRTAKDSNDTDKQSAACQNTDRIMRTLIPIPDSKFLKLKAQHLHKVEISKLISANPNAFPFILSLKMRIKANLLKDHNK